MFLSRNVHMGMIIEMKAKSAPFFYFWTPLNTIKSKIVCSNFDTLPLLSHFRFTHFVGAVGMLRKEINHHLKAETISKRTVHSQLLQNNISPAKIYFLVIGEFRAWSLKFHLQKSCK